MDKITPFGKLQETEVAEPGAYSVHFELPYNPEAYLISEITQLEDDLPLTLENFQRELSRSLDLLRREDFGLGKFLPEAQLVWGTKEGDSGIRNGAGYVVRKRILGEALESSVITKEIAFQLDEFLCGALKMYQATVDTNGFGLLPDLLSYQTPRGHWDNITEPPGLKNFLIGHYEVEKSNGNRLFFTDVYPLIKGGRQYLGFLKEGIVNLKTADASLACPNTLALIDQLGYEKATYVSQDELGVAVG